MAIQGRQPPQHSVDETCRWLFGTAEFDEAGFSLSVSGRPAELERKSMLVLLHLLRHAGEVVTKEELFEAVWTDRIVTESVLTRCMSRIRAALGDAEQKIIKTVHGYGYRFAAPVKLEYAGDAVPPALSFSPGNHPPLRPHWRLLERLGQGGHGEAWLAAHAKTGERRVYKFASGPAALGSLKREITLYRLLRESLGERAGFVDILDWNLDEPPCYIECAHIPGGNLADWARAKGGLDWIELPERLELIAQIADALSAAHNVGVLHKDLKPANVLIDTAGNKTRIRLCDFGSGGVVDLDRLARLGITRLGFTRAAVSKQGSSGTPFYLAPEILSGQPATVQGDIFALGVILYQAIAGDFNKPLAPGWEQDVADELLREDIADAVFGDPHRRLSDAATLARRLRSLKARRAERSAAAAAQAREARNRRLRQDITRVRWAAMLFLLLAVVASVAGTMAYRARDEAYAAQQHALSLSNESEAARQRAEQAKATTEAVSRFMNNELLGGMRRAPQPHSINFETVLEQAGQRIDEQLGDFPEAAGRVHLLFARRFVTRRDRSLAHLERAIHHYEKAEGPHGNGTLTARLTLAELQMHTGLFSQSLATYEAGARALATRYGPEHLLTQAERGMRNFVAIQTGPIGPHLAHLLNLPSQLEQADATGADTAWYLENRYLSQATTQTRAHLIAVAQMHACWALLRLRTTLDAAQAQCRQSTTALERLYGPQTLHALIPKALWQATLVELNRLDEAERLLDEYGRVVELRMNPESFWRVFHRRNLGILAWRRGQLDQALPLLREAVAGCPSFENCNAIEVMYTREALAGLLLAMGQPAESAAIFRSVLELRIAHQGAGNPWTIIPRIGLAAAALAAGDRPAARRALATITPAMLEQLPQDSLYRNEVLRLREILSD